MPGFPIRRTVRPIGAPTDINSSFARDMNDMTATIAAKLVREIAALAARNSG